jgi:hypothetical protein
MFSGTKETNILLFIVADTAVKLNALPKKDLYSLKMQRHGSKRESELCALPFPLHEKPKTVFYTHAVTEITQP